MNAPSTIVMLLHYAVAVAVGMLLAHLTHLLGLSETVMSAQGDALAACSRP
jgi:hypothetical protein